MFRSHFMSSNGPKNFKEMQFPPPRDGARTSIYAPLPPAPPPRGISQQQKDKRASQLLEMKTLVNTIRCPLCGGQLDGNISYENANLYCASYSDKEYRVSYEYGKTDPVYSVAILYTTSIAYQINHMLLQNGKYSNTVYQLDLTLNDRNQQSQKKVLTSFEGARFFLSKKLGEKQLLEKIKLYNVFS